MAAPGTYEYRAVVKGSATQAIHAAQNRGFVVLQVLQGGTQGSPTPSHNTILLLRHVNARAVVDWLAEGPSAPPFPDGALLFYKDDETQEERKKVWIAPEEKGYRLEPDLEGLGEFHPFSVSTLVPGLHGKPTYRYFDDFTSALVYARDRARKGPRLNAGGRAYFILGYGSDPDGVVAHRVFRAFLGAEQAPGSKHYTEKREFVMVQSAAGTLPHNPQKTHWVMEKSLSVEILNAETEKARKRPFPRKG